MRCASLLLLGCGCLARARAQEDADDLAGSEVQSVDAFAQDGVDNGHDDIAVDGIWHDGKLYVAIQTTDNLKGNAAFGEHDAVIYRYDAELGEEELGVQIGSEGEDFVMALAGNFDLQGDIVMVGSTQSESLVDEHMFDSQINGTYDPEQDPTSNWFIATLDRDDLTVSEAYVNGTLYESQQATAVAFDDTEEDGGSYYVAGWTWGEYFAENVGSDNDGDIGYDAWVVRINNLEDQEEDLVGSVQFGSAAYDVPTALVTSGINVYVVGNIRDDGDVLTATQTAAQAPIFVKALDGSDLGGPLFWELDEDSLGTLDDNTEVHGAVLSADTRTLYVSGHTEGTLPDYEGEATDGAELFVMSIDAEDGIVNWVWQSEANATAFGRAGLVLADDGDPIVGAIVFGNLFNLTYEYWEFGSGDFVAAKIAKEYYDDPTTDLESPVAKYFVAPAASNLTREEPLAIVRDPEEEDDIVFLIGKQDGDFDDEDVEPEPDADADDDDAENLNNVLVLKIELDEIPDPEIDDGDDNDGPDYDYWPITVAVFGGGIVLFYAAYKWAEYSKARVERLKTMV